MPGSTLARADEGKMENVKAALTRQVPIFLPQPFPSNHAGFMAVLPLPQLSKFPQTGLLLALPWGGNPDGLALLIYMGAAH